MAANLISALFICLSNGFGFDIDKKFKHMISSAFNIPTRIKITCKVVYYL